MIVRSWFCVLLTGVFLFCGCNSQTTDETATENIKESTLQTTLVEMKTSMGNIVVELDEKAAPVTVKNFLQYVDDGFYDGTIFHRVIHRFMIQGGGLTPKMEEKKTHDPIVNEASNGLKNKRGAIAMARGGDPDSATCQFFINHMSNPGLDYVPGTQPGYAVFGKVVEGMDVVDAIAFVKTTTRSDPSNSITYKNVPVEPIVIKSVKVVRR